MTRTERWVVTGRVQGVGYRDWLRRAARGAGLGGFCRNREDGAVEVLVHGPAEALDALHAACRAGPPRAAVRAVTREIVDIDAVPVPFERR